MLLERPWLAHSLIKFITIDNPILKTIKKPVLISFNRHYYLYQCSNLAYKIYLMKCFKEFFGVASKTHEKRFL